jgi:hypothetical protein
LIGSSDVTNRSMAHPVSNGNRRTPLTGNATGDRM